MINNRIQLFSGGLDSYALWHLLDRPRPVYVRYGHKYEGLELEAIGRLEGADPALQVSQVEGPGIGHLEAADGHIPHRNLLLITTAVAEFQPRAIYIGALKGEASRDKSHRFLRQTTQLLSFSESKVRVLSPSKRWTKTQLVARFLKAYPDRVGVLKTTRSCYAESQEPCGRCLACFRRWVAMSNNGLQENYQVDPWLAVELQTSRLLKQLLRIPFREWLGVLQNNLEAARALRRARGSSLAGNKRPVRNRFPPKTADK